jgi:hypothetical protein
MKHQRLGVITLAMAVRLAGVAGLIGGPANQTRCKVFFGIEASFSHGIYPCKKKDLPSGLRSEIPSVNDRLLSDTCLLHC